MSSRQLSTSQLKLFLPGDNQETHSPFQNTGLTAAFP